MSHTRVHRHPKCCSSVHVWLPSLARVIESFRKSSRESRFSIMGCSINRFCRDSSSFSVYSGLLVLEATVALFLGTDIVHPNKEIDRLSVISARILQGTNLLIIITYNLAKLADISWLILLRIVLLTLNLSLATKINRD